jgi:hypothetical protein
VISLLRLPLSFLRFVLLLGTPTAIGVLAVWHPAVLPPNQFLSALPLANQWFALHLLQLGLLMLLALVVVELLRGVDGSITAVSRGAIALFAVCSIAFDPIFQVSLSTLLRLSRGLAVEPEAILAAAAQANPSSLATNLGMCGWAIGVCAAAIALHLADRPRLPLVLLALSALFFGLSQAPPFGPLGMVCFGLAALLLELNPSSSTVGGQYGC